MWCLVGYGRPVSAGELVSWAEEQVSTLLPSLGDRWVRVLAVGGTCPRRQPGPSRRADREVLVAGAYLHGIGAARSIAKLGLPSHDGA
jgi:hypothetical protein